MIIMTCIVVMDNNFVNKINIPTGTSNLDFSMVKDINPAFSYANNVGRFGGVS